MARSVLDSGLRELNTELIEMGALCEKVISLADKALMEGNSEAAKEGIALQDEAQEKGRTIESLCMKLLLTQQPFAQDLRAVSAALKMITDMNRICVIGGDMCDVITFMDGKPGTASLSRMAVETSSMVSRAIDAFVRQDVMIAHQVIKSDDSVDELFVRTRNEIVDMITEDIANGEYAVNLVMVAKYYEKIGDHAVNIAQWVTYAVTGVKPSAKA